MFRFMTPFFLLVSYQNHSCLKENNPDYRSFTHLEALQSPIPFKESNHSKKVQKIDLDANKQGDFEIDQKIIDAIRSFDSLKPLQEASKREQIIRVEAVVFFCDCVQCRLESLDQKKEDPIKFQKSVSNMLYDLDAIKLMMGIPVSELRFLDKDLAMGLIHDIEYEN